MSSSKGLKRNRSSIKAKTRKNRSELRLLSPYTRCEGKTNAILFSLCYGIRNNENQSLRLPDNYI